MATTDNSKILRNDLNRSLFAQKLPVFTSQKIGQINPSICSFGLPSETQKLLAGTYYELKPLVSRLTTGIKSNNCSAMVYFKDLWHNWDKFIAKGPMLVRNGAFNVPYIEAQNENTNYQLPYVFVKELVHGFLASSFGSRGKLYQPQFDERTTDTEGNKVPYDYHFFTRTGRYIDSALSSDVATAVPSLGWWIPRLIGTGYNTSGVNLRLIPTSGERTAYEMYLTISKPEVVTLVKALWVYSLKCWAHKEGKTTTTLENLGDFNNCCIGVSEINGSVHYTISLTKGFQTPTDNASWDNNLYANLVVQPASSSEVFPISQPMLSGIEDVPSSYYEESDNVITFKSVDGVLPVFAGANGSSGTWSASFTNFYQSVIITALLDTPELLGRGSLMESMGHHLFESYTIYEIMAKYADNYDNAALGFSFDATYSIFNFNLLDDSKEFTARVNLLPYVGYQKVLSERFLLAHQILSNNDGNDSTLNDKPFDSPYHRNNLVPTMLYGQLTTDHSHDYIYTSTLYGVEGYEKNANVARDNFKPQVWHNCVGVNQLLTLFVSRSGLMEMDVFTKIWQKQDRNLQDLLQTAEIAITDSDDVLQAKKFAITKALSRFSLFGQLDQMCTSVVENHFGISAGKSDNHQSIMLHKDKNLLPTIDIFNQGGAVNDNGDSRPLGDRTNVITYNVKQKKYFEVFFEDYGYFINLHWFSVPTVRQNVPNAGIHLLEKLSLENDIRFAFQLATFPEFQNTGDEQLKLDDIEAFGENVAIAWTNKNNTLKDGFAQMCGEFKDKYKRQIVTPYPIYRKCLVAPSLTYAYLQPTPFDYDLPLVDRFGAAFLIEFDNIVLKKSPMTKQGLTNIF